MTVWNENVESSTGWVDQPGTDYAASKYGRLKYGRALYGVGKPGNFWVPVDEVQAPWLIQ